MITPFFPIYWPPSFTYLPAVCGLDCGPHGQCLGSSCVCSPEWQGPRCNMKVSFFSYFHLKSIESLDNVWKSFVCYCNQLVGLFQVSRQQTGLVQRLSGVLWFLRVYEEDGETASIALYDFIWHCQQRLLNRPLQLVVVFRWENPNDQVVQILPSLSHILALRSFVWK